MEKPHPEQHTCKSCHAEFTGNYCPQCGERVIRPQDRSFRKVANDLLKAVTFADSKFFKTLLLILGKPGVLSFEFANGRTVRYMAPISVFFILNLAYFFFPVIQLFNASLNTQLMAPYGDLLQEVIARKIVRMELDLASFSLIYNIHSTSLAKLMVMIFVVIASAPLNLLFRGHNRYFTDHLNYAVELASFNLFVNAIVLSIVASLLGFGKYLDEGVLTGILIITNLYFIVRSGSVFYHEKGWVLALKSVVVIAVLKLALEIYRAILFFVTIQSL